MDWFAFIIEKIVGSIVEDIVWGWDVMMRAPLDPREGFRFIWLPVISVSILLVFYFFKKGRYSFAWYQSFSAPGIIVLPLVVIYWVSEPPPSWASELDLILIELVIMLVVSILFPVSLVCPIVFFWQLRNIRRRRFAPVSGWTVLGCLLIIYLYLCSDISLVITKAEFKYIK